MLISWLSWQFGFTLEYFLSMCKLTMVSLGLPFLPLLVNFPFQFCPQASWFSDIGFCILINLCTDSSFSAEKICFLSLKAYTVVNSSQEPSWGLDLCRQCISFLNHGPWHLKLEDELLIYCALQWLLFQTLAPLFFSLPNAEIA